MRRKQLVRLHVLRVMILAPSHPRADTPDHPPAPPASRARFYTLKLSSRCDLEGWTSHSTT